MSQTESWAKKVKEILRKLFLLFYQSFSVQTDQPIEMWPTKTHEMCRKKYLAKYLRDIKQWLWCLNWCFFSRPTAVKFQSIDRDIPEQWTEQIRTFMFISHYCSDLWRSNEVITNDDHGAEIMITVQRSRTKFCCSFTGILVW